MIHLIALLLGTGIAGDGTEQTIHLTEGDAETEPVTAQSVIDLYGQHNIAHQNKAGVTLRAWQTEADVPLPSQAQIDAVRDAVGAAETRTEQTRQDALTASSQDASSRLGDRLAAILTPIIQSAYPPASAVQIRLRGHWLQATTSDSQLLSELEEIRNGSKSRKKIKN